MQNACENPFSLPEHVEMNSVPYGLRFRVLNAREKRGDEPFKGET